MTGGNQENDGKKYLRVVHSKHPPLTTTVNSWKEGTWEGNINISWFQIKSMDSIAQT